MNYDFLHVADVHLGYHAYDAIGKQFNQREEDIYAGWMEFLGFARATSPSFILIAGDLFDSNHPEPAAYAYAKKIQELNIPTVIIMGNHEVPRKNGISPIQVLEAPHVIVCTTPRVVEIAGISVFCAPCSPNKYALEPADLLLAHGQIAGPVEYQHSADLLSVVSQDYVYCAFGDLHHYWRENNLVYPGNLSALTFATEKEPFGFVHCSYDSTRGISHKLHQVQSRKFVTLDARNPAIWEMPFDTLRDCVVRIVVDDPDIDTRAIRQAIGEFALHVKIVRIPIEQDRRAISIQGSTLKDEYVDYCKQTARSHLVEAGIRIIEGKK